MSKTGSAQAAHRLQQELMQLMSSPTEGITAFPHEDNLFHWVGTILGAASTAYEGLEYRLSLRFSPSYPFEPPQVVFLTPCFHPNVDTSGAICLDILKENWSAAISISELLLSILSLLDNANTASPLNHEAARLWREGQIYRQKVLALYGDGVGKTI
eukprot:PhF_6_TR1794/c0_g1_i1/m.2938/K06688/UBE2C, UBC11; ubiquitin-conjugating enzyme E2 C